MATIRANPIAINYPMGIVQGTANNPRPISWPTATTFPLINPVNITLTVVGGGSGGGQASYPIG